MNTFTTTPKPLADKTAMGLSSLCMLHCLALPALLAIYPSALAVALTDELFHTAMVFLAIPVSAIALSLGCREHKSYRIMVVGFAGLLILVASATVGHDLAGEVGEKALTVVGALLVFASHLINFRMCRQAKHCECDA